MVFSLAACAACSFLVLQMPLQDTCDGWRFRLPFRDRGARRRRRRRRPRRRRGADTARDRADAADARGVGFVARAGAVGDGVPPFGRRLPGDERRVPRLLAEGPADANDRRRGSGRAGRARRAVHDRGAGRRRTHGRPPRELDQVAESVQLCDPIGRHALHERTGGAQRTGQLGGRRRCRSADESGAGQRPGDSRGRRPGPRERRQRAGLPAGRGDVRGDERDLPRVLPGGAAGARDGARRAHRAAGTGWKSR